ncbi:MAG: DUF2007 domain-containing protein [Acidobacteriota bacterium]
MQIDPEEFKRHYAMLSDEALLEIDRDELVDTARGYYDAELAERNLAGPDTEESASPAGALAQSEGDTQLVATFLSLEEANFARGLLRSADIPCSFENEQSAVWSGIGELRLMVPAAEYDRACEILDTEISEEDLIAQAEAEAAEPQATPASEDDSLS